MQFRTKIHLLNYLNQELALEELQTFARFVSDHHLNEFEVKVRGDAEAILRSLRVVPKAILEDVLMSEFSDLDEDEIEDQDEDDEDCSEDDDEDESDSEEE
jgi:hypothetical protein